MYFHTFFFINLGHKEIVEVLVKAKANTNERDANDLTPLNLASLHGHTGIVSFMQQSIGKEHALKKYDQFTVL